MSEKLTNCFLVVRPDSCTHCRTRASLPTPPPRIPAARLLSPWQPRTPSQVGPTRRLENAVAPPKHRHQVEGVTRTVKSKVLPSGRWSLPTLHQLHVA